MKFFFQNYTPKKKKKKLQEYLNYEKMIKNVTRTEKYDKLNAIVLIHSPQKKERS